MSMPASSKSFNYFYKQMGKSFLPVFIIFIMLMITLPAYSATLVEEEEVKSPEIVQETAVSNEQTEVQQEVKSEGQSAEIVGKTTNNKIHETDSKTSGNGDGAGAVFFVVVIFLLIGLGFGGFALRTHVAEKYAYDIFSIGNIFIACIASFFLLFAVIVYNESGMSSAVVVFIFAAVICYAVIFAMIVGKTDAGLAVISVLYLFAISAIIVFVIVIIFLKMMGDKKGK